MSPFWRLMLIFGRRAEVEVGRSHIWWARVQLILLLGSIERANVDAYEGNATPVADAKEQPKNYSSGV